MEATVLIYFDGSCEPVNPGGTARYGYRVLDEHHDLIHQDTAIVCKGAGATNNVAEWAGVMNAIKHVVESGHKGPIEIYGDSKLVINQLNGQWKCKKEHLQPYLQESLKLLEGRVWSASWIPREKNQEADDLSKGLLNE